MNAREARPWGAVRAGNLPTNRGGVHASHGDVTPRACAARCRWRECAPRGAPHRGRAGHRDRKSTRLNSSHSQISYAVFCLKKKKKIIIHPFTMSEKKLHKKMF